MLTIRNITQIELEFCHSRGLKRVNEITNDVGEPFYAFYFGPIGDGKDWNKATEIRLKRTMEWNGSYQIFVMGLQVATEDFIFPSDIKTKDGLVNVISKVLAKTKVWWETNS